ncbi:MAG: alpha-galactosidase [Planctomycetia bacterium]|nr:alpha-galactosidase [Planctomycetia bacterium]
MRLYPPVFGRLSFFATLYARVAQADRLVRFASLVCFWSVVGLCSSISACEESLDISFVYEGQKADLSEFETQICETPTSVADLWTKTYTAPDKKLRVEVHGKRYKGFPVVEYSVRLRNLSTTEPTGVVSDFRSLDVDFSTQGEVELRSLLGSHCGADDFAPVRETLASGGTRVFATPSGRSSNECMPFLELNRSEKNGILFAIAWTGGWRADFTNLNDRTNVKIGMNRTHFRLLPSESVIQPGIVVFERKDSSRREFQTLIHRFMLEHKVPRDQGGDIIPPILAVASGGGNKTPEMMLSVLDYVRKNDLPFDTYWVDAGWYGAPHEDELYSNCGPNWYRYAGDWRVNTTTHPSGTLLPISNAVHDAGMKFLLWFEPERVQEAPIRAEQPKFCNENLLNYGDPDALRWIQNVVYGMIEKHQIDVYRQDFNMDPARIWAKMDSSTPDRVGIAEAKHIEGVYRFLDEMRERFPNILLENCASGGRRIDIAMIQRAHSYCRSDYYIGQKPNDTAFILGQNATRNTIAFLPFQGCEFNCVPVGDDYAALSIISSGVVITPSDFEGGVLRREFRDEETHWFKRTFDLAARMKPYWSGNFYALTEEETPPTDDVWCGWQFDDPRKNSGFALVFRRRDAPDETRIFSLGNIAPDAQYEVEFPTGTKKRLSGKELQSWRVTLPPRAFELIFYTKIVD